MFSAKNTVYRRIDWTDWCRNWAPARNLEHSYLPPTFLVSLIFIPGDPAIVENDVPSIRHLPALQLTVRPHQPLWRTTHPNILFLHTPNLDLSGSLDVHITSWVTAWEAGPNELAVVYRPPSLPTCSSPCPLDPSEAPMASGLPHPSVLESRCLGIGFQVI
ncbi:hypothetical protein C8F01DRAFT_1236370 [Mycena amicta]|nr:hypothetical protein C8F01DRAFT_1236370 [Mycena amicta]